jgi:hypothetical protein
MKMRRVIGPRGVPPDPERPETCLASVPRIEPTMWSLAHPRSFDPRTVVSQWATKLQQRAFATPVEQTDARTVASGWTGLWLHWHVDRVIKQLSRTEKLAT